CTFLSRIVVPENAISRAGGNLEEATAAGHTGMSVGSPSGAPPSTQSAIRESSSCVSPRSFLKRPKPLTAFQGGIRRVSTSSLIATAHGRASAYVDKENAGP